MSAEVVHGTTIARGTHAVLLRGPSGSGKSDLALRLIDQGWQLVSDDQTKLEPQDGRLLASAPEAIAGKIEVRGLGIQDLPTKDRLPLRLVVDLCSATEIERLPEATAVTLCGLALPRIFCDAREASAPIKVRLALAGKLPREADAAARATSPGAPARIVLVSGLSGAGHSTALKILEDLGFEAIDNLPIDLLPALMEGASPDRALAIGIDVRTRHFAPDQVVERLDALARHGTARPALLFLDCADDALVRRFDETRRPHPLAADGRPVLDGIAAERQLTAPLRDRAEFLVDTTNLTPTRLGQMLAARLGLEDERRMVLFVTSFSYRAGLPPDADYVFDARFLANPHYQPDLKALSGRDPEIRAYLERDPAFKPFLAALESLLAPAVAQFENQAKSYMTLAVGCTGGRHRSVAVAEALAAWLRGGGRLVTLTHRDIDQDPRRRAADEGVSELGRDSTRDSG